MSSFSGALDIFFMQRWLGPRPLEKLARTSVKVTEAWLYYASATIVEYLSNYLVRSLVTERIRQLYSEYVVYCFRYNVCSVSRVLHLLINSRIALCRLYNLIYS